MKMGRFSSVLVLCLSLLGKVDRTRKSGARYGVEGVQEISVS